MRIIAIDPGTTESGWVWYDDGKVANCGVSQNAQLLKVLEDHVTTGQNRNTTLAIEMVASMGMAVGAEVFETCVWVGMFMHAWGYPEVIRVTRNQVKLHLCGTSAAKDPNVRQAIIDLFPRTGGGSTPQIGTKKQQGPLYRMSSHMWPALGVALTVHHQLEKKHAAARAADERPALRRRAKL